MRVISTDNIDHAFPEDVDYSVMFDKEEEEGRILENFEGDEIVALTFYATSIDGAVAYAAEHMLGDIA
jgi:hypothetical protein